MTLTEEDRKKSLIKNQHAVVYAIKNTYRKMTARLLEPLRTGPDKFLIIPPIARGGNWLYEWLEAYSSKQKTGHPAYIQYRPSMDPWIQEFPLLDQLTLEKNKIKFRTIREIGVHQNIQNNFTDGQLKNFIHKVLLSSENFQMRRRELSSSIDKDSLVINIRRGDYYTSPAISQRFGIDTIGYIKKAVPQAFKESQYKKLLFISDDLKWCRENLSFLKSFAPVDFKKYGKDMFDDLALLSLADNIVLTNTTFGYWGAYIACIDHPTGVWAANIHERGGSINSRTGQPIQHLPTWQLVSPDSARLSWLDL